jgi:hypothetical protein
MTAAPRTGDDENGRRRSTGAPHGAQRKSRSRKGPRRPFDLLQPQF